jgi:hypothetical protein
MTTSVQVQNSAIKEFGSLFLKGFECLLKACQLYVQTIDKDPDSVYGFQEAYPDIPSSAWRRFEAVGRGSLHVKLLTNLTVGAKKLERCSFIEQSKYIENPVDVLLTDGDVLKVDIHNLQPSQVKQVFAKDHVRSKSEQKAYIESIKSNRSLDTIRKARVQPYEIVKGKLIVGDLSFTRSDLIKILALMEK